MTADPFETAVFRRDVLNPIPPRLQHPVPALLRELILPAEDRLRLLVANLARAASRGSEEFPTQRDSAAALWAVIALEAVSWARLGVESGALPDDFVDSLFDSHAFWRAAIESLDEFGDALTLAISDLDRVSVYQRDFLTLAALSREALTEEHLEFLRLVHFAPDAEWGVRVDEVAALLTHPDVLAAGLSTDVVDRLSWALSGLPEQPLTFLPSDWRWWWIQEPQPNALRQRSGARWAQLRLVIDDLPFLLQPLQTPAYAGREAGVRSQFGLGLRG